MGSIVAEKRVMFTGIGPFGICGPLSIFFEAFFFLFVSFFSLLFFLFSSSCRRSFSFRSRCPWIACQADRLFQTESAFLFLSFALLAKASSPLRPL